MKVSYLIDTDWAVHHLNGVEKVRSKLAELRPHGLGLSTISLAELYEGVYYSRDPQRSQQQLEAFLSSVVVLDVSKEICQVFGRQRGFLRQKGLLISDFDLLIAATCLHHDLALLTNNLRHFQRIERLEIVSIDR